MAKTARWRACSASTLPRAAGFTQIDLLAALLTLGLLFAVFLPAMAGTRVNPQGTQCLNNLRQLSSGWMMYANENIGKIMPNTASQPVGYGAGPNSVPEWILGYLSWADPNPDNTNTYFLAHSLIGPYVNFQTAIYKCPADYWQCTENGVLMNRVRSYSMNYCMEGDADDASKKAQGIPLDQVFWASTIPRYAYHRLTDLGARLPGPSPAGAWVLCDEHPDTINNGALAWGSASQWADLPASYHESGDNFCFADGHVEYHQWLSGYNAAINGGICAPFQQQGFSSPRVGFNAADYNWVTSHATAPYP